MGQLNDKELNAEIDRRTRELLELQQERMRRVLARQKATRSK